jgi:hypothetical protein
MPYELLTAREKARFWIMTIFFSPFGVATLPIIGLIIGVISGNELLVIVLPVAGCIAWLAGNLCTQEG